MPIQSHHGFRSMAKWRAKQRQSRSFLVQCPSVLHYFGRSLATAKSDLVARLHPSLGGLDVSILFNEYCGVAIQLARRSSSFGLDPDAAANLRTSSLDIFMTEKIRHLFAPAYNCIILSACWKINSRVNIYSSGTINPVRSPAASAILAE